MKAAIRQLTILLAGLIVGLIPGILSADTITIGDLPDGDVDTLAISLLPGNGAVRGVAGATVGWGFAVSWSSTGGDYLSFIGSSIGSVDQGESNPALQTGYTDFIGAQGGPTDFAVSPSDSPWTEEYDGVSNGVGAYQIASDPLIAAADADDTGEITFDFLIFNGDPITGGQQIGDDSYSYYGQSTQFSVTVDAATPEPGTAWLAGLGLAVAGLVAGARRRSRRGQPEALPI